MSDPQLPCNETKCLHQLNNYHSAGYGGGVCEVHRIQRDRSTRCKNTSEKDRWIAVDGHADFIDNSLRNLCAHGEFFLCEIGRHGHESAQRGKIDT